MIYYDNIVNRSIYSYVRKNYICSCNVWEKMFSNYDVKFVLGIIDTARSNIFIVRNSLFSSHLSTFFIRGRNGTLIMQP